MFPKKLKNCQQPIRIEHEKPSFLSANQSPSTKRNLQLRQPIRIEYYVTRVVSPSELSIKSPESSRLGWRSLLGSRLKSLAIAYLNTVHRELQPPSDLLTHRLFLLISGLWAKIVFDKFVKTALYVLMRTFWKKLFHWEFLDLLFIFGLRAKKFLVSAERFWQDCQTFLPGVQ